MTAKLAKRQLELTLVRSDPTHPKYVIAFIRSGGRRQAYSAFTFLPFLLFFAGSLSPLGLLLRSAWVAFLAVSSAELVCGVSQFKRGRAGDPSTYSTRPLRNRPTHATLLTAYLQGLHHLQVGRVLLAQVVLVEQAAA